MCKFIISVTRPFVSHYNLITAFVNDCGVRAGIELVLIAGVGGPLIVLAIIVIVVLLCVYFRKVRRYV